MNAQRKPSHSSGFVVIGTSARDMNRKKAAGTAPENKPRRRKRKISKTMHQRWVANIFLTLAMLVLYGTGFTVGLVAVIVALIGNTFAAIGMFPYAVMFLIVGVITSWAIRK